MVGLLIVPLQTRFGYQVPDPEKLEPPPPQVGVNGMPVCACQVLLICQPPTKPFKTPPLLSKAFPVPKGNS